MRDRLTTRRLLLAGFGMAALGIALLTRASVSDAVQGPAKVRGNVPGEWRYWGGDAWSTRYSSLDQINAGNFGSLEVAWQWSASPFGADEYYRTTPSTRTAACSRWPRRGASPRRSIRKTARRSGCTGWTRTPLAEGAPPVRRTRPVVLERRGQ